MRMNTRIRAVTAIVLGLFLMGQFLPLAYGPLANVPIAHVSVAHADDEAWEQGKACTAMLADKAKEAAALVATLATAAKIAALDLSRAQAAVAAAGGTAAATTAEALAALAGAETALAVAVSALAAAELAAGIAAAIVAGATIGTLAGQGLRGIWSWCWDPVCPLTPVIGTAGAYVPATEDEINGLLPEIILLGTGQALSRADFDLAGEEGAWSWQFMFEVISMYLGAARAAAAATVGRDLEVLETAVPELQGQLDDFPDTILVFDSILEATELQSPVPALQAERTRFDEATQLVITVLESQDTEPAVLDEVVTQLNIVSAAFDDAQTRVNSISWPPLVGAGGAFESLSLDSFQAFIEDCRIRNTGCLPPEEILIADRLLEAAGVYFPDAPSFGPLLARYDAEGDNSREEALFEPTGSLTLAELLRKSVTELSTQGPWLNITLSDSGLARELISRLGSPPVALPRAFVTSSDTPIVLDLLGTIHGDCGLFFGSNPASNGTLELTADASEYTLGSPNSVTGSRLYTPDPGFSGVDSFTYWVYDQYSNTSELAAVTITVSSTVSVGPTVVAATSSIADELNVAWGWDPSAQAWMFYSPAFAHLPGTNTLTNFETGKGYWINVERDISLLYGNNLYDLVAGWNLIGWLGP